MSLHSLPLLALPLDAILVANRLRPVDQAHAATIAASMRQSGLLQPIMVMPTQSSNQHRLVAGAHRLEAARLLGWSEITCQIADISEGEARLAEIDENLMRHELDALDRALFMAERKAVHDAVFPEVSQRGRRKKELSQSLRQFGERFSKQVSKRTGLSERAVQMALQLAAKLNPEAVALLRNTKVAANQSQLFALSDQEPADQAEIASLIAKGEVKNVPQALQKLGLAPPAAVQSPDDVLVSRFMALWAQAGAKARARMLDHVESLNPAQTAQIEAPKAKKTRAAA